MKRDTVTETAARWIRQEKMIPAGCTVLAAVSGGADSMCLLQVLRTLSAELDFRLAAAHFNHRLRGAESDADEAFVTAFCADAGIPLQRGAGDVAAAAAASGRGIEETARELRYAFLRQAAEAVGAVRIATAHTADDNAETVLLRLARGTGIRGLAGIPPVRDGIIRPLLGVAREDVEAYLRERSVPWREDSSNDSDAYARNRIRHAATPALRSVNPAFAEAVLTLSRLAAEDDRYLTELAEAHIAENFRENALAAGRLAALPRPVAGRVIRQLCPQALTAGHVDAALRLAAGEDPSAVLDLPGITLHREYDRLVFAAPPAGGFAPVVLTPGTRTALPGTGLYVSCAEGTTPGKVYNNFIDFIFNKRAICGKLRVRQRAPGDALTLPGRCRKTLKKLLAEAKIPASQRERIPVLADELGPLAVYGLGLDVRAAAGPGDEVWQICFEEMETE